MTTLRHLASIQVLEGRLAEAERLLAIALAQARAIPALDLEGLIHGNLGVVASERGDFERAIAEDEAALAIHRQRCQPRLEAIVLTNLGVPMAKRGDLERAILLFRESLELHRSFGNSRFEAVALMNLGLAHLERAEREIAGGSLTRGVEVASTSGALSVELQNRFALALLRIEEGALDAAREQAVVLLRIATVVGTAEARLMAWIVRGLGEAASGRVEGSDEAFAQAERIGGTAAGLEVELGLARCLGEVARCRASIAEGALDAACAIRDEAQRELGRLHVDVSSGYARILVRMAEQRLSTVADSSLERTWRAGPDGAWFQPPGGERVSLDRRPLLARLLAGLVERRRHGVILPLPTAELIAIGWPDECCDPSSLQNRLNVALHALRRLGLQRILVQEQGAYRLDESVPVLEVSTVEPVESD